MSRGSELEPPKIQPMLVKQKTQSIHGWLETRGWEQAIFLVAPAPGVAPAPAKQAGSGGSGCGSGSEPLFETDSTFRNFEKNLIRDVLEHCNVLSLSSKSGFFIWNLTIQKI